MRDGYLDWHGRQIFHRRSGSGTPVVFCHGTPFSSEVWRPFADALSGDFAVHTWDMPGYGRSSKNPDHPVDFGTQAAAFRAVLQHWDLRDPHVVAHDFGGAVALRAHLAEGVSYSSLMLVDAVSIPPSGSPFFSFVHDHPRVLEQLPGYIHEAVVRTYIRGASHRGLPDDVLDRLVAPWLGDEGQPAFYRQIADYDEAYLRENEKQLDRIACPVRILWGTEDGWLPVSVGRRLHDGIAGSSLTLVDGSGHLMQYDAPVPLMDQLRTWLDPAK